MARKIKKRMMAIILAAVMVLGVPCGVYANTVTLSMKVYQSTISSSSTGVVKTNTTYSNASCTAISGANNYCHISIWLVDANGNVATGTESYEMSNQTKTLTYKPGYGVITKTYYARAQIDTGSATSSTTFKYSLTP